MGRHTGEELEIIALIERMQDRRLTAAEAAIALAQAYAIGELSEPPDNMPAWDVVGCKGMKPQSALKFGASGLLSYSNGCGRRRLGARTAIEPWGCRQHPVALCCSARTGLCSHFFADYMYASLAAGRAA